MIKERIQLTESLLDAVLKALGKSMDELKKEAYFAFNSDSDAVQKH